MLTTEKERHVLDCPNARGKDDRPLGPHCGEVSPNRHLHDSIHVQTRSPYPVPKPRWLWTQRCSRRAGGLELVGGALRASAIGPAILHHARRVPVPVNGGEEVADHVTLELDSEGPLVQQTHAVGSRVAFAAHGFEGAADEAVCDCR